MEIIFKEENGKLFGSTNVIGIGKRQPELIYGEQAKKLREQAGLSTTELANKFKENEKTIIDIENQKRALNDKLFKKYAEEFNVDKEYFFDLDLETLILSGEGHIIKSFDNGKDCKKAFDDIMEEYMNAIANKDKYIIVDFTVKESD